MFHFRNILAEYNGVRVNLEFPGFLEDLHRKIYQCSKIRTDYALYSWKVESIQYFAGLSSEPRVLATLSVRSTTKLNSQYSDGTELSKVEDYPVEDFPSLQKI